MFDGDFEKVPPMDLAPTAIVALIAIAPPPMTYILTILSYSVDSASLVSRRSIAVVLAHLAWVLADLGLFCHHIYISSTSSVSG